MTPSATSNSALTVLDHLIKHLRARSVQIGGQERPAAILWTDPKAEWTPVIPTIQTRLDELLVLGDLGSRHAHGTGDLDPMSRRPDTRRARTA